MNTDSEAPGYRHIIFRTQPVDYLSFVKYFTETPYGKGGISWKNEDQQFSMEVIAPVGCEATVYIPIRKGKEILENGRAIKESDEIRSAGDEEGYRVFNVKSGTYLFLSK